MGLLYVSSGTRDRQNKKKATPARETATLILWDSGRANERERKNVHKRKVTIWINCGFFLPSRSARL